MFATMSEPLKELGECNGADDGMKTTKNFIADNFLGTSSKVEDQLKFFERVLRVGVEFKNQAMAKAFPDPVPANGISCEELRECYQHIAKGCSNWASPSFVGVPDAGHAVPSITASLLIPLLNRNLANQDVCAPSAIFIEMEQVHCLRKLLGFPVPAEYSTVREIGGVLTLGGCLSNTVALMAAREYTFPGSSLRGLPIMPSQVRVLVPEIIGHYSIRSAMAWLGLGEGQVFGYQWTAIFA